MLKTYNASRINRSIGTRAWTQTDSVVILGRVSNCGRIFNLFKSFLGHPQFARQFLFIKNVTVTTKKKCTIEKCHVLRTLRLMACFLRTEASSFCNSRTCVCKSSHKRDFSETVRLQAVASPDRFSLSSCSSSWTLLHLRSISSNFIWISSLSSSNDLAYSK